MAGRAPEQRISVPAGVMRWESVGFVHWAYPPDVVQRLLPPELQVDTFEDRAWVGITPFVMSGVRPPGLPAVPLLSTFPETNVRTYVRTAGGVDGLWFFSLDTTRSAALLARAAIGTPYCWAAMRVTRTTDEVVYTTARRRVPSDPARSRIGLTVGAPIAPTERDHWLTGRWRAFSRARGRLWCTPVEHEPWPLQHATAGLMDQELLAPAGLPAPAGDPLVHWSPGVSVRMGAPRSVG
ncbi:MAG TPA: DUF2071 domain-containing protein [Egibacteraceae bacterium]|nr:DUF2071 domain-containing protein [Egibacteraceae bacterium]